MYQKALCILKRIVDSGYVGYIVGGYARDHYLGIMSHDIDICTNATFEQLSTVFLDGTIILVSYGSMRLFLHGFQFEITTFRRELGYVGNRYPSEVVLVDDLYTDLLRRDFVINTLCIDEFGKYIDLLGAREDLEHKVVRTVGEPMIRLEEDCLRILRAIRFATVFGFSIDPLLEQVIVEKAYLLKKLSFDRKKGELDKIFASKFVLCGLNLLKKYGLCSFLHLSFENVIYVDSYLGIWAQCDYGIGYSFSRFEKKRIAEIRKALLTDFSNVVSFYNIDWDILNIVCQIRGENVEKIHHLYGSLPIHSVSDLDISVSYILSSLSLNGKKVRVVLDDLIYQILSGNLKNQSEEIKRYLFYTYSSS